MRRWPQFQEIVPYAYTYGSETVYAVTHGKKLHVYAIERHAPGAARRTMCGEVVGVGCLPDTPMKKIKCDTCVTNLVTWLLREGLSDR